MCRFVSATALSRASLLASLALASCGVPDDPITFATSFRVESFQISPSPPVAGERVHFEVVSASVFEVEISQASTVLIHALKPLDRMHASFIAETSDVPSLWARGRDFAELTVTATPWSETCHADGRWSTNLSQSSGAGCDVGDGDPSTAPFDVSVGGELAQLAGRSGAGRRTASGSACRWDFAFDEGESAVLRVAEGRLEVTLKGTDASGAACTATWAGTVTPE